MSHDPPRPDPDALLRRLREEDMKSTTGRLCIFLGMCPGVGKTFAMLQTARQRQQEGVNVLVGLVETHGRTETAALLAGMNVLQRKPVEYHGVEMAEFDLDASLSAKPDLILVDELAHTNAPGSRHVKRYQDVLELLDSGIDVYTTLNVQHIESQVDVVRQITGIQVNETVPDSILDRAQEIQLIDLSVEKLLERLNTGRVYFGERAVQATQGFFKEANLTALRELALRFTAGHVDRDLEDIRRARRVHSPWKTNARLMVGVAPSPYAESLIRWTRRAATRLNCPWLVVWVEGLGPLSSEEQQRLTNALSLARKLGGEVITVTGESVPAALLRVARDHNVTQIVVGKPDKPALLRGSLAHQIILGSGEIDVCVVRPYATSAHTGQSTREPVSSSLVGQVSWVVVSTFAMASICWGLRSYTGYMFVALVFLLGVVLAALRFNRGPVILMAALSALCWNFLFIPPQFTFYINKAEDWIMFGMFFIVALSMGSLTSRLRQREAAERRRASLTEALLRVTQSAALAAQPASGLAEALRTINELLQADTALVVSEVGGSLPQVAHSSSSFQPGAKEWGVITWVYANKQCAGRHTDTLPESLATWFPLQTATSLIGVLGVQFHTDHELDFATRQMIEAFALQLALVLEKEHFIKAANRAALLAHSEKLHRTLLDSISHELKTPLAVINAAVEAMNGTHDPFLGEISSASQRLQRVVDNLLQMTRLESEVLRPHLDWCDLHDVIAAARQAVGSPLDLHPIKLHLPGNLQLVRLDHSLITQAVANILHNACLYTPEGSEIEVGVTMNQHTLRLVIRDHGPGLPDGAEELVFEKFYRSASAPAGGTGLGLAIARGFVQALGGSITARNHPQGGAEFELVLQGIETLMAPSQDHLINTVSPVSP